MTPGALIKQKRIQNGMTRQQLADALGMTRSNLSFIERDISGISLKQAIRFAQVLCFNLDEYTARPTQEIVMTDLINDIENKARQLKARLSYDIHNSILYY